jgi:hypothetical protein
VLEALLASGYAGADTALSSAPPAAQDERDAAGAEPAASVGASIRHTAERLFGAWQHKPGTAHPDAGMHERYLVTLTAETDPDAERAVGIIERFSPAGIEDLPVADDPGSAATDMAGASRLAGRVGPLYTPGTGPGALQHRPYEDSHYFGVQNAGAPPAGNTFQETMGGIMDWTPPEDVAPAAGEELDSSAVRYGADAAQDGGNRGLHWSDVEDDLKSDWEREQPGEDRSPWNKVKAAVRHGWDRVKSR